MNKKTFCCLLAATGLAVSFSPDATAVTEVTFSRSSRDEIVVEANGQRQIFRSNGSPTEDAWAGHTGQMMIPSSQRRASGPASNYSSRQEIISLAAPSREGDDWTASPTRKKPEPTKGKILRNSELPTEMESSLETLSNEEGGEMMDPAYDSDPKMATSDKWTAIPEKESSPQDLSRQVRKLRMENARLSNALNTPLMLFYQGDTVQMEWGNAKQKIPLPADGVVRIRLAPRQ